MTSSFRFQLAARFAVTMTIAILGVAGAGYLVLRAALDGQIEVSLLNVASIQAASVTDDPSGRMHFHEWNLTPEEAASLKDLNRYTQIWNESGQSLLRSQFLTVDLPLDSGALEAAAKGQLTWSEGKLGGTEIRSVYYPLGRLGASHTRHVLQVAAPLSARNHTLAMAAGFLAGLVVLVSSGTFAGSWWLADRAVRPVHEVIDQAEEIGAGTLGRRIAAHADTREYRRLVEVLNTMLARIDALFEAQRRFIGDASHELRSPLTALRGELELALRRERNPEEYRRVIGSALEETERLTKLTEDLLTLARSDAGVIEPRPREVDLVEVVKATVGRLETRGRERQVQVDILTEGPVWGFCDPELLARAVWNLLDNAIKFTTRGGHIKVSVVSDNGVTAVEVADSGPGIREGDLEKVFDRFYQAGTARTRTASGGAGLGLSIVRAIAEAHGGRVSAQNRPEGGARLTISLPESDGRS